MTEKMKKEAYVSIDKDETQKLEQLPHAERWLYMKLKWLANFRTGKVGRFGNRVLSYKSIGEMIGVPSSQGRAAVTVSGGEVKRMLDCLHTAGLISPPQHDAVNGVSVTLTMSPIAPPTAPKKTAAKGMLQNQALTQTSETPASARAGGDSDDSLSVLMSFGHNNTFFNTDSTDGAGDTPAHTPVSPETPPTQTAHGGLSAAQFHKRLTESWYEFQYLDTDVSQTFYRGWEKRHVTEAEFDQAVERVESDDSVTPTPGAIEKALLAMRHTKKPTGRGKVAL